MKITMAQWKLLLSEIQWSYARSSGPGGQKVNKTETKVEVRWKLLGNQALTEPQTTRLELKLLRRMNQEGEVAFQVDRFRSRERNRQQALQQLETMLSEALFEPKKRRKTRPPRKSKESRLNEKKSTKDKKNLRKKVDY